MDSNAQLSYSIKHLAGMLGSSKSQIVRSLRGCHFTKMTARGGACKKYAFEDLPAEIRCALIAKKTSIPESLIAPAEFSLERAGILFANWEAAPQWSRDIAILRKTILDALTAFADADELPITQAEWKFAEAYNEQSASGVPATCYERIKKTSAPNLDLWRRNFKKDGLPGLLSKLGAKLGRFWAVTPEMRVFIAAQLALNPDIRVRRLHEMLAKQFPESKTPDRTTVANYLKAEWRGKEARNRELHTLQRDPREWRNRYMAAFGSMSADVPHYGHTWEQDSSPCDVICKDGVRYAGIFTVDVFSRRLKIVWAPTSKSTVIAACTREALLDWGIPKRVRMDNGQDYASVHVDMIYTALSVDTPPLPIHTPEAKPFVERAIGSFMRYLAEILPGFCGHSVGDRQAIRERGRWMKRLLAPGEPVRLPITAGQLKEISDSYIKMKENQPHRGLGGKSPLQVAHESPRQPEKIRDERVVDVLLAPVAFRVVGKKGIELDGGFYTSPRLVDHIGKKFR